jgi:hypothetical protein
MQFLSPYLWLVLEFALAAVFCLAWSGLGAYLSCALHFSFSFLIACAEPEKRRWEVSGPGKGVRQRRRWAKGNKT